MGIFSWRIFFGSKSEPKNSTFELHLGVVLFIHFSGFLFFEIFKFCVWKFVKDIILRIIIKTVWYKISQLAAIVQGLKFNCPGSKI